MEIQEEEDEEEEEEMGEEEEEEEEEQEMPEFVAREAEVRTARLLQQQPRLEAIVARTAARQTAKKGKN